MCVRERVSDLRLLPFLLGRCRSGQRSYIITTPIFGSDSLLSPPAPYTLDIADPVPQQQQHSRIPQTHCSLSVSPEPSTTTPTIFVK
jgi:hypothetical protein